MAICAEKVAERRGLSEVDRETAPVSSGVDDSSKGHLELGWEQVLRHDGHLCRKGSCHILTRERRRVGRGDVVTVGRRHVLAVVMASMGRGV